MNKSIFMASLLICNIALATNFPTPEYQAIDISGDPISGAIMSFYGNGTTKPQQVYSDADLTNSLGTYLIADSSGYFTRFFMKTDAAYKVILRDADSNTLWSVDDLWANNLVSDNLNTRIKQIASNPLDYGAIGDGVADESSEVQQAIDNATGVVDLLGLTYRCDSTITLDDGLTLQNGTLDFSQSIEDDYLTIDGTQEAATALTSDAARGAKTVAVTSASGLSGGDWVIIKSDDIWASYGIAEIAQIASISSLNVTLTGSLDGGYLTADNAELIKLNPSDAVTLRNLDLVASKSASGDGNVLVANTVSNLYIENTRFNGFRTSAIHLKKAINTFINNVYIFGDNSGDYAIRLSEITKGTRVYGSSVNSVSVSAIEVSGVDSDGGVVRDTYVDGLNATGFTTAVNIDEICERITIVNSTFFNDDSGSDYGVYSTGTDLTLINTIWRGVDDLVIFQDPDLSYTDNKPWTVNISDNRFEGGSRSIDLGDNQSDIIINNNIINDPDNYGIYINTGVENVAISSNIITNPGTSGIAFVGAADNITVSNNIINGTSNSYGLYFGIASNVIITNNLLDDASSASTGIYVATSTSGVDGLQISGNKVTDYTTGVEIVASGSGIDSMIFTNNAISGVNSSGDYMLYATGTVNYMTISGNIFSREDDSAYGVYIASSGAVSVANSNFFQNGSYCLFNVGGSTLNIVGNIFQSCSIADHLGVTSDLDEEVEDNTADIATNTAAIATNTSDIQSMEDRSLYNWFSGLVQSGTNNILDVALGEDGSGNTLYVAVGESGVIYTSYNGVHWSTQSAAGSYSGNFGGIEYGGGKWVAVGTAAEIQTSTDGITWTAETPDTYAGNFEAVAYNGSSLWVTVGSIGEIQTATDPTGTWTSRTAGSGFSDSFADVDFDNSEWVAVGEDYEIQHSDDGITWTQEKTGGGSDPVYYAVEFANSIWVAAGGNSTQNVIWTATDPESTWTSRTTALRSGQQNFADVKWDPNLSKFLAVTFQTVVSELEPGCVVSSDGITWAIGRCPDSSDDMTAIETDGSGQIIIVGKSAQNWHSLK